MLIAIAVLGACVPQEPATPTLPPSPHDRVVQLEITATDPVYEGHGHGVVVEHATTYDGTLNVWTQVDGDFDTLLRVSPRKDKVFEFDNDGGGVTPLAHLRVYPGTKLVITVIAAGPGATGKVQLLMRAAPETEATLALAKEAAAETKAIRQLIDRGDATEASERTVALGEKLLALPEGAGSDVLDECRGDLQIVCHRLGLLQPTERLRRAVVAYRERMLPSTDPNLLRALSNLAVSERALGRTQEGRDILERLLDVATSTLEESDPFYQSTLNNLSVARSACRDLIGAKVLAERLVDIRSRSLAPRDHRLARVQSNRPSSACRRGFRTAASGSSSTSVRSKRWNRPCTPGAICSGRRWTVAGPLTGRPTVRSCCRQAATHCATWCSIHCCRRSSTASV